MTQSNDVIACIETIEAGYEFMLAYAAQGRAGEGGPGPSIRKALTEMRNAMTALPGALQVKAQSLPEGRGAEFSKFGGVLGADLKAAVAALDLVLSMPTISSQLVDNLNASVHVRATLTDLFLIDEAIKLATKG